VSQQNARLFLMILRRLGFLKRPNRPVFRQVVDAGSAMVSQLMKSKFVTLCVHEHRNSCGIALADSKRRLLSSLVVKTR